MSELYEVGEKVETGIYRNGGDLGHVLDMFSC